MVTATYRLPLENIEILSGAPPIMMRIDGDGFSGQGSGLVALPPKPGRSYRIKLRWDLKAMGAGAEGVSCYGDGDLDLPAGSLARIDDCVFMAGHVKRYSPHAGAAFSAVWLGTPSFDPVEAMTWTGQLHAWMSRHFKDRAEPPYRVFLRYNPMNAGGGAALTHSFIFTYKPGITAESIKSILGHEMTHTWTAEETLGKWYDEGDAVYYQALLPWRAGLISTDAYLQDVNETASRYYTNPEKGAPDSEILKRFWSETFVRVLPYDRGALYFAVLNGKIQRASRGRRSIDDLVQAMVDRRKAGLENSTAVWLDLLKTEIGADAVTVHEQMMAGGLMLPESSDNGPCFRSVGNRIRRFDLGFDNASVLGRPQDGEGIEGGFGGGQGRRARGRSLRLWRLSRRDPGRRDQDPHPECHPRRQDLPDHLSSSRRGRGRLSVGAHPRRSRGRLQGREMTALRHLVGAACAALLALNAAAVRAEGKPAAPPSYEPQDFLRTPPKPSTL